MTKVKRRWHLISEEPKHQRLSYMVLLRVNWWQHFHAQQRQQAGQSGLLYLHKHAESSFKEVSEA